MSTTVVNLPHSATHPLEQVRSNSDGELPDRAIYLGTAIDVFGTLRQMTSMLYVGASLTGRVAMVSVTGACVAIALLLTGIMSTILALTDAIPDAHKQLAKVQKELERTQKKRKLDPDKTACLQEVQKTLTIARLGMANQYLFLSMGLGQIVTAITSLLAHPPAILGVSKAVEVASATASVVANCVLSGIYFLRGIVAIQRANKNLALINEFATGFKAAKAKGVEVAIQYMIDLEERFGPDYLSRRLDTDSSCLGDKKASLCGSLQEKVDFLKLVEKAMYSQKLKHEIARGIGVAMIVGAILAIIAMQLAATPTALYIVEGISAAFFLGVEIPFLINDNPTIFEKWRDWRYAQAEKKMTNFVITEQDKALDHPTLRRHKYQESATFASGLPLHTREKKDLAFVL